MTKYVSIFSIYSMFSTLVYSVHSVHGPLLYNPSYHSLLHSSIGSIMAYAISTNSLSSALSSCNTYLIKSIILASSSSPLSLKTSIISKLSIKGTVPPSLFASIYTK